MGEKSFDRLLEAGLQEIEKGRDIERVLRRHPEQAEQLRPLLQIASSLREQYAEVPEPQAQLAVGRARLRREAQVARRAAAAEQVVARRQVLGQERRTNMRLRLVPTLVSIAAVVAVWMAGMAGVALAADAAGPGEPLYGFDRAIERIQLRLTYNPEAATQLRMRLTEERMSEIQELVRKQDQERLQEALGEYGNAVGALTERAQVRERLADPARLSEMEQTLARNEEQMRYAFQVDDDDDDDTPGVKGTGRTGNGWYTNTTTITHPVALSLAHDYEISATQVVSWFADGYGFGEIMHALKTSENITPTDTFTDTSPSAILDLRAELGGWGQVWQALGLIGRPDDAGPPDDSEDVDEPEDVDREDEDDDKGPPDHAGPKDEDDDKGPPDHAGPKDEDKDPGPPDHAGPKDDENGDDGDPEGPEDEDDDTGPPDHAGPKNNNGNGPPNGNSGK
jgi:hypothetical protein